MEVAWPGASCSPPRARISFPALGWIPGHTVSPHRLYSASVDADAAPTAAVRARRSNAATDAARIAIAGVLAGPSPQRH
jgi:hypothetical protein